MSNPARRVPAGEMREGEVMAGERTRGRASRKAGRPVCPATGKIRYRDAHDAGLALVSLRRRRSRIESSGGEHRIRVQRKYECPSCGGWHLTSQARAVDTRTA